MRGAGATCRDEAMSASSLGRIARTRAAQRKWRRRVADNLGVRGRPNTLTRELLHQLTALRGDVADAKTPVERQRAIAAYGRCVDRLRSATSRPGRPR